jgi:hypothetical protein
MWMDHISASPSAFFHCKVKFLYTLYDIIQHNKAKFKYESYLESSLIFGIVFVLKEYIWMGLGSSSMHLRIQFYQIKSCIIKIVSKLMSNIFWWKGLGSASIVIFFFFIKVKRCCILFLCEFYLVRPFGAI